MFSVLLSSLLLTAQAVPVAPVANAATPTSIVNSLAVKRNWTGQDSEFCKARAAQNAYNNYPRAPLAKLKFIKTFAFRGTTNASSERTYLDVFNNGGFQTPFPWQEGQWLARQYTAQPTPRYTYLLELQDRPKEPNRFSTEASVCITVFGIR
ncbi:hypothetical protein GO986_05785 [Deinococcus sp. HMF7620]|uniref:Secreted protein n=1 Tax=Deinococcus arboris TaxID=2682977 RepID=A0A7C9I265_9DEIO|nr:hypothetical protein [Deinococcus arboris]MVN86271.1 hypothetical protein [Deinococcus arboris]